MGAPKMGESNQAEDRKVRDAVQKVIDGLISFDDETRTRILRTAATFYQLDAATVRRSNGSGVASGYSKDLGAPSFSDRQELSPKEFLFQKQPKTDLERVGCLAYYLTHYRDTPHFKTVDISKLNTEAAQIKFSNTAYAVANAANAGLLASAGKGAKQISALGERYVDALPDRNAAKEVMASMRRRRNRRNSQIRKQA
jgi:hypothetical protein